MNLYSIPCRLTCAIDDSAAQLSLFPRFPLPSSQSLPTSALHLSTLRTPKRPRQPLSNQTIDPLTSLAERSDAFELRSCHVYARSILTLDRSSPVIEGTSEERLSSREGESHATYFGPKVFQHQLPSSLVDCDHWRFLGRLWRSWSGIRHWGRARHSQCHGCICLFYVSRNRWRWPTR